MKTWILALLLCLSLIPVAGMANTESGSKVNIRSAANNDDWDYSDDDWLGESATGDLNRSKRDSDSDENSQTDRSDYGSTVSSGSGNNFGETTDQIRFHLVRDGAKTSSRRPPPNYKIKR